MSFWRKAKWFVKGVLTEYDWEWLKNPPKDDDKAIKKKSLLENIPSPKRKKIHSDPEEIQSLEEYYAQNNDYTSKANSDEEERNILHEKVAKEVERFRSCGVTAEIIEKKEQTVSNKIESNKVYHDFSEKWKNPALSDKSSWETGVMKDYVPFKGTDISNIVNENVKSDIVEKIVVDKVDGIKDEIEQNFEEKIETKIEERVVEASEIIKEEKKPIPFLQGLFAKKFAEVIALSKKSKQESDTPKRHHAERKKERTRERVEVQKAIVGIDFGTSFTKAYCNVAGWGLFAIRFDVEHEKSFFLPSVLYYNSTLNTISLNVQKNSKKIEYFKYGVMNNTLSTNRCIAEQNRKVKTSIDILCSIFFMAQVMKLIKNAVMNECGNNKIIFSFNMGCPLDNFGNEAKGKYDFVLNLAEKLSQTSLLNSMKISDLDDFVENNSTYTNPALQTIPELYAEALWFIEQDSIGEGIYSILDIGGGTVDFATIAIKWTDGEKKTRIYSQCVAPYGVEILLHKLFNAKSIEDREICVKKLKEINVEIPSYSSKKPLVDKNHRLGCDFRTKFFQGIMDVKRKDPNWMKKQWNKGKGSISYYVFGGGADFNWYHSIIANHNQTIQNANIPHLIRKNVGTSNTWGWSNIKAEVPDTRLIIAQQLSRPYFPEIEGFPWDYKKIIPPQKYLDDFGISDYGILDT